MRIKTSSKSHTCASLEYTKTSKFQYRKGSKNTAIDYVITEQPLQIKLVWQQDESQRLESRIFSITMRTPGNDKALIIGLMLSEGIITNLKQIESIEPEVDDDQNTKLSAIQNSWEMKLCFGVVPTFKSLERFHVTYSSCGLCGTTSLKSLELKNPPALNTDTQWLDFSDICTMPEKMQQRQASFTQTGGSHAAALYTQEGCLVDMKEDIGRHNALDKLLGESLIQRRLSGQRYCVVVSGRISFEIVQKTLMAGVAVLIAVGAPSDLAIAAAQRFDLTLIGFTHKTGFNLYHGDWRLSPLEDTCQKI